MKNNLRVINIFNDKSSHTEDILNVSKLIPSSYIPDSILFISSFHLKILEMVEQIPDDLSSETYEEWGKATVES